MNEDYLSKLQQQKPKDSIFVYKPTDLNSPKYTGTGAILSDIINMTNMQRESAPDKTAIKKLKVTYRPSTEQPKKDVRRTSAKSSLRLAGARDPQHVGLQSDFSRY